MPSIRKPEEIGALTKTSSTTAALAPSRVNIGGQQYRFSSPLTLSTSVIGLGGFDTPIQSWKLYSVFVVVDANGQPKLIASSEAVPAGYAGARAVGFLDTDANAQINGASNLVEGKVGQVRTALLSESQFQSENGVGWILADGRDITGSRFASLFGSNLVPDLRGLFLRGKNGSRGDGKQNPDGDISLGAYQADMFASHSHLMPNKNVGNMSNDRDQRATIDFTAALNFTYAAGGNETRARNATVNYFIKVN